MCALVGKFLTNGRRDGRARHADGCFEGAKWRYFDSSQGSLGDEVEEELRRDPSVFVALAGHALVLVDGSVFHAELVGGI